MTFSGQRSDNLGNKGSAKIRQSWVINLDTISCKILNIPMLAEGERGKWEKGESFDQFSQSQKYTIYSM